MPQPAAFGRFSTVTYWPPGDASFIAGRLLRDLRWRSRASPCSVSQLQLELTTTLSTTMTSPPPAPVLSVAPVSVMSASTGSPSGRNRQCAALMTQLGLMTVPVHPAAPSSSPSPSWSQAARMNEIDGQSSIAAFWPPTMLE